MNNHVNFESENQEFLLEKMQFFKCGNFAAPPCIRDPIQRISQNRPARLGLTHEKLQMLYYLGLITMSPKLDLIR